MFTDNPHTLASLIMTSRTALKLANKHHDEMQCYMIIFTFTLDADSDNRM